LNYKPKLHFRSNGTFTLVQFTDIHWQNGDELDAQSRALMERVLDIEKPDFVMFTGDTIYAGRCEDGTAYCRDPRRSLREAVSAVEERCVPWGLVFGNHDTEYGITREQLMNEVARHTHSLARSGVSHIHGTGNYVQPIFGSASNRVAALLYALDSGAYSEHPAVGGYDWIRSDQIAWYREQSDAWRRSNQGLPLPALAFFHIPLPEYDWIWNHSVCYGEKNEKLCAPFIQSGFFAAMLEQGDVIGAFCGHDHINDFIGSHYGIHLGYGRATGYNTYGKEGMLRGARVIRLTEGSRKLETWLRLADGTALDQLAHFPESL
jgi:3',5'-cyclic AMP phosphodiesterase CpdA